MPSSVPPGMSDQIPMGGFKGIPQAPMQNPVGSSQRGMPSSTPDRILLENARIQYEQRRLLEQQRQLQQGQMQGQAIPRGQVGPSSSPNMNAINGLGGQSTMQQNNALMQALQAASNSNGMPGNGFNGYPTGTSASPRMSQSHLSGPNQPQQLSNGMIPQVNAISHQIKARHPQLSQDQVTRMATDQLLRQHQMSQSAMNAAAGGGGPTTQAAMMNSNAPLGNPQLYAQMLRAHQASQSRGSSSGSNGARPPSRSATPQNQRGDGPQGTSGQPPAGQNQSPRPPQAQMAAGQ
jgi:chromatin modification-related protein VID21